MRWLGVVGILLWTYGNFVAAGPQLFVVIPNLMRFDSLETVTVNYNGGGNPVEVKVSLQNYPDRRNTWSAKSVVIQPNSQGLLRVITSSTTDLPVGSLATKNYVYVRVRCDPLRLNREVVVLMTGTKGYLFLQTDKPIYTPKQKVNIRAISLNPEMIPTDSDFTMDVMNPNQTVFKRFQGKSRKGIFSGEVQLPDITVLGNWSVTASYKNRFQAKELISKVFFEVREYVLPTFSVTIKSPDYIIRTDTKIQVTVAARYVYKEDVKGRLTVLFSLSKKDGTNQMIDIKTFDFDGKLTVELDKNKFSKWFPDIGSRLVVEAAVTESASGKQEKNSDSTAVFVNSVFLVSFDRTTKYFKPGLPYNLNVKVKYASGRIASHLPMSVEAKAKQVGRHERIGVFRNDADNEKFFTNIDGEKSLTLDVPGNTVDLVVTVKPEKEGLDPAVQGTKTITLRPQRSPGNNFLSIQLINAPGRLPVNQKLQLRVDFTENVNKEVTFMVLARGKILNQFVRMVNGLSKHDTIDVLPAMSPQARLLVFYTSKGSEVVADSLLIGVVKECEQELELSHNLPADSSYRPGENVHLKIKSSVNSLVSLLGVDKAVYLLSERDILSRDKMFNTIMDLDLGCGPGSGANVGEIFRDSGVYVVTNSAAVPTPRRADATCPTPKVRKRRSANQRFKRSGPIRRVFDALLQYNEQDGACCNEGASPAVQRTLNSKSCATQAQAKRQATPGCRAAFLDCCEIERIANMPSGRSINDNDLEVSPDDIQIESRKDFDETWIYEILEMSQDEETIIRELPDSITTWVVSALSVSEDAGMCVAKPLNLTAKKEFFVHADLPYAAVRGEQLEVKATVYNFGRNRIVAHVYLRADQSEICFNGNEGGQTEKHRIILEPKSGKKVTFPAVPLKVGQLKVHVVATTSLIGDEWVGKLYSRAEGVKRTFTYSSRLDPWGIMGDGGSGQGVMKVDVNRVGKFQTIKAPLKFPDNAIPGTKVCSVSVSGTLLGPMVPSVDLNMASKIHQPTGCGEQTMIHMGPLVYTTRYMKRTNTLTGNLEKTAYGFILAGFERELTYRHPDGSYAAWQSRGSSSWLTAFVAKVFCQASEFPNVGKRVGGPAKQAVDWLVKNAQTNDGRFHEKRRVIHTEMFGQNLLNSVTFTSFVVEAISKCGDVQGVDITTGTVADALNIARGYLEQHRNSQNKPYEQAILTYALALQNSPHAAAANAKLRSMSSIDAATGMRYWRADGTVKPEDDTEPAWYKGKISQHAIETASYALLAQLALNGATETDFVYAGPIASWLIRQRRIRGAFVSTTDTIIALEALTEYAFRAASRTPLNMKFRVWAGNNLNENFVLTPANAYDPISITKNLPIDGDLFMKAEGSGLGQVQVECQYNSPELKGEICTFDLQVSSAEADAPVEDLNVPLNQLEQDKKDGKRNGRGGVPVFVTEIEAKFSYIGEGNKVGMSILDVTLFTGFIAVKTDLDDLLRREVIDRYEITASSVLMYLGEVKKGKQITVSFRAKKVEEVKGVQPAAVKIYDYYEPDKHYCTKFYHPQQGSPLLATFCEKDRQGRKVCQCAAAACAQFWGFKNRKVKVKTKAQLDRAACTDYDYAVKVIAGPTVDDGPLRKMTATVDLPIKQGSRAYSPNDKMFFVWKAQCEDPVMNDGVPYLVMGKDGEEFLDKHGQAAMRYVLDSNSHTVEWYDVNSRPRYHRALELFARELRNNGCNQ